MDYADGCDGGSIYKIFEYAAEQGLYEEDCHTYTFSGDPVTHFTARADGSDPICTLRYHGAGVRRALSETASGSGCAAATRLADASRPRSLRHGPCEAAERKAKL